MTVPDLPLPWNTSCGGTHELAVSATLGHNDRCMDTKLSSMANLPCSAHCWAEDA